MKEGNFYVKTKVVSRTVLTDFIQNIRNLLGLELKAYSNTINEATKELLKEAPELKNIRVDIENMGDGAFSITISGVKK